MRYRSLVLLAAATAWSGSALAGENPCGDLELVAIESCQIVSADGCQSRCEPAGIVAACDGQCNAEPDDDCRFLCESACDFDCDTEDFVSCEARCNNECTASVDGECQDDCRLFAEVSCAQDCAASCVNVEHDNNVTCDPYCDAVCAGVCENSANAECIGDCSLPMARTCEETCNGDDGAIFCDGQFVAADDRDACLDLLAAELGWDGPYFEPYEEEEDGCGCRAVGPASGTAAPLVIATLALALSGCARRRRL